MKERLGLGSLEMVDAKLVTQIKLPLKRLLLQIKLVKRPPQNQKHQQFRFNYTNMRLDSNNDDFRPPEPIQGLSLFSIVENAPQIQILKVLADFRGESICRLSWKVFADFGGNNYTVFQYTLKNSSRRVDKGVC